MTSDEEMMVTLLASARAEARKTTAAKERDFAGKFLCLIFDPVKQNYPAHSTAVTAFRNVFPGIAHDATAQEVFRNSLLRPLLTAPSLKDALDQPLGSMVAMPMLGGEG